MHPQTDSEANSLAPSSPDHTRRPEYYVQSPSRDSRDGEKTGTSLYSAPMASSPMGSPSHTHSRETSTSRFSGTLRPGPRKITPDYVELGGRGHGKGGRKNWQESDMIEEEGLLEDEESRKTGLPCHYYFLAFVVAFCVLFSLFALILWGASKTQKPKITVRSIKFERFMVQAGSDNTGVSTEMITTNATLRFTYKNTANFFGVHVSSPPATLSYAQLNIGYGHMKKFYQSRNGARNVTVVVIGDKIPLYGSGAGLSTPKGMTTLPVPLKLDFAVRSRAYVLGKLVKHRFIKEIECSIVFDVTKLNVPISLKKSCKYD